MNTHALKQISQAKLLLTLEQCKQISKDDRLILRKMVKDKDEELMKILYDSNNKKIQIKLRKFLQKCKENKKVQVSLGNNNMGRYNTVADCKYLETLSNKYDTNGQEASVHGSAGKNLHKSMKKSLQFIGNLEKSKLARLSGGNIELKKRSSTVNLYVRLSHAPFNAQQKQKEKSLQKQKVLSNTLQVSRKINGSSDNRRSNCPKNSYTFDIKSMANNLNNHKYTLESNYLTQKEEELFTPAEFLKWDINLKSSQCVSNTSSLSHSRMKSTASFYSHKSKDQKQKAIYNFKSALIKHYAEDIFDSIASKYFPLAISQKSIYLPYRQFLYQIQIYLVSRGEDVEIIKENDINILLLKPFLSEYEGVSLKNLGTFLNSLCLHKNNPIRGMFIVLDSVQSCGVSVQKFSRINSWKGKQLIEAFERLVRKYGDGSALNYWEAYWVRNQKEFMEFEALYFKI